MADILRGSCGVSFPPTAPTAYPPAPTGRQLVAIPRGRATELRLALENVEGRSFVSVRTYRRDLFGLWWPGGGGYSIRPDQLAEVIAALQLAAEMIEPDAIGG